MNTEEMNSVNFWNEIHKSSFCSRDAIICDDWLNRYADIINACNSPILDLGCGSGNDTKYFMEKDKTVYACDQSSRAIYSINANFPEIAEARVLNMIDGFEYADDFFGIVVADLSLHYFDLENTARILGDIRRILKPDGYLFIRVNSVNDINYGACQGEEIEHHFYRTDDGMLKRFFDEEDIKTIFSDFEITSILEDQMNRYAKPKFVFACLLRNR